MLILGVGMSLSAGDVMIERMQSVVDEVSELRQRYEHSVKENEKCLSQLKNGGSITIDPSTSSDKARIQALEYENMKLKEAHETAKVQNKRLMKLQDELEVSKKEQKRLNTSALILVEKNHSLLAQVNKLKGTEDKDALLIALADKKALEKSMHNSSNEINRLKKENSALKRLEDENSDLKIEIAQNVLVIKTLKTKDQETKETLTHSKHSAKMKESSKYATLEKENRTLHVALQTCNTRHIRQEKLIAKSSKGICVDDNPFPKLMPKKKKIKPVIEKKMTSSLTQLPGVFRINGESTIYDKLNGKAIEIWEDTRSFTSNIYADEWVRITGYFVNKKWQKAKNELWVKREDVLKR